MAIAAALVVLPRSHALSIVEVVMPFRPIPNAAAIASAVF
jgi:hypothetical protein